jgi:hypothetical protein
MKNFADGINPSLIDDPIQRRHWTVVKQFLRDVTRALANIVPAENDPSGSISSEVPTAPTINTRVQHMWHANGPYRVGTAVDGGFVAPSALVLSVVKLHRTTPGSSGDTFIDINKNGISMYVTNPLSKPRINFGATTYNGVLPSSTAIAAGDVITMDIDAIEGGTPRDLTIVIEGA